MNIQCLQDVISAFCPFALYMSPCKIYSKFHNENSPNSNSEIAKV